jgi:DNA-binding transcriptional regulator YdaS (Cro superfamily)
MARDIPIESATKKAVRLAGGPKAVAKAMKIKSLWSIYKWLDKDEVPPKRVPKLVALCDYEVSRYELRPDLYEKPSDISHEARP